jgi:hypothetical protein
MGVVNSLVSPRLIAWVSTVSADGNRKSPRREARIAELFSYDAQETRIAPSRYGRETPAT